MNDPTIDGPFIRGLQDTIVSLRSENQRLRKALDTLVHAPIDSMEYMAAAKIARAALAQENGGGK